MPLSYKQFKALVAAAGCTIQELTQHRSLIFDENGNFLCDFSRKHGKNQKRNEILDCYVSNFRNALKRKREGG